ncbi:MAG: cation-transporting P-type ATPase, partial [Clostridia bacterium]|nr:cation-transporting P-type ATPase [Clostridia bacterium]
VSVSSLVWLFADLTMVHSNSWWKALVVLGVCLLGAAIDITKEAVSMKRLIELRNSSQPTATVLRSEQELTISARQLVRGDILFLKQGDYVPADGRILQSEQLRCDEGTLSGEPVSVEKQCEDMLPDITPLAKRSNMVYAGSTVTNGTATVVVVAAGEDTESAKMALIHEDPLRTETPLQKQWKTATRALGTIALVVSVLVFLLGVTIGLVGDDRFVNVLGNTYMACAALAVTVVPESLATTISTVLAVGVSRMCQHKLLVRSMDTAEVLGKVSVICTDKTGTLTQNQMTMTRMYMGEETMAVDDETKLPKEWKNLLLMGAMCCDAQVQQENGKEVQIGDHTEAAIVSAACRFSEIDKETLESMYPRLCEIPFDSDRKLKTSVNMIDGKPVAIVKGAPDIIMERCPACDQEKVTKAAEDMANSALRVIGIAFKALEETPSNPTQEELEYDLIFGGLVGLEDPPIPETVYSLEEAKNAGIKVVMMTGDQLSTAMASAREMGIESDETSVITNEELIEMTDEELDEKIDGYNVYVRLTPELKERVIASLQRKGYVVAVTGDKVEDASLLRQADVGCAMGQDGTDVAKGAAHAVVTDNNFATILYGVSASRGIYENIRRSIFLTIGFGVGLGLLMVCSLIFWQRMPLDAVQIMLLNLLVSVASVLPLGLEPPANKGLLDRAPRKKDRVFDKLSNITAM